MNKAKKTWNIEVEKNPNADPDDVLKNELPVRKNIDFYGKHKSKFYEKYIKYKNKYLALKSKLISIN